MKQQDRNPVGRNRPDAMAEMHLNMAEMQLVKPPNL